MVLVAAVLMTIGLVMVASATVSLDRSLFDGAFWRTGLARQTLFTLAGLLVMMVTARIAVPVLASPVWRHRMVLILALVALVGLVAAMIPGLADPHRGAQRWLRLEPSGIHLGVQPSELAKLAIVALLASHLAKHGVDPRSFRASFLPAVMAIGVCALLVGSADFSTSVLLATVGGLMLLVAGCRLRHLLCAAVVGACGLTALLLAAPYRLARITAYRDIWADPRGDGYQPLQSLTTIASGGWLGWDWETACKNTATCLKVTRTSYSP